MYNISSSNPITVIDLTIYSKQKVLFNDCGQILPDKRGMYVCITRQELLIQSRGEFSLSKQEDIFILINICLPNFFLHCIYMFFVSFTIFHLLCVAGSSPKQNIICICMYVYTYIQTTGMRIFNAK